MQRWSAGPNRGNPEGSRVHLAGTIELSIFLTKEIRGNSSHPKTQSLSREFSGGGQRARIVRKLPYSF